MVTDKIPRAIACACFEAESLFEMVVRFVSRNDKILFHRARCCVLFEGALLFIQYPNICYYKTNPLY